MKENKGFSQPLLEIKLLGRFRVMIDGIPVEEKRWSRNSAKSLVKLLAIKPLHTMHREQVMDLLWTELNQETAVNNLNKAIHGARRAFEPNLAKGSASKFILTSKNQIVLASPGSLLTDLDEFERLANYALQNNNLEVGQKAIELYKGDLLGEDIYEDWIYTRRESIRILFRKTATKVAGLHATKGNHQASIEILKKLAADDSSDEYVHRMLMRLYAETGSKYQALKQFEYCRATLHTLGIEPESETIKLEQSIKRGEILPVQNSQQATPNNSALLNYTSHPHLTPLTFQNGCIKSARFLPDGESIILTADWNSSNPELYLMQLANGEVRPLGRENAEVLSVSPAGDLAIMLNPVSWSFYKIGTLAKMSAGENEPIEILEKVHWADWCPLESSALLLAIVRERKGKTCLEFPIDNVIYETEGWLGQPRFSPDGKKIAFVQYPFIGNDKGFIVLYDLENHQKIQILTESFITIQGLAWVNDEIWFTAGQRGSGREIKVVNLTGEVRTIYKTTGNLTLHDSLPNGKFLVTDDKSRVKCVARHALDKAERDLSWHDWTLSRALTDDGETLLFEESGAGGGDKFAAYVRKIDGSSVKKIGDGSALALSPDEKYALVRFHKPDKHLALLSVNGTGEIKRLEADSQNPLDFDVFASFFPDGKRIIFTAGDSFGNKKIYLQRVDGGKPVCFNPDEKGLKMLSSQSISPDGKFLILTNSDNCLSLYRISDGTSSPLKNLQDFWMLRWVADGENLFVWRRGILPAVIYKYNLGSGKMQEWLTINPKETNRVSQIGSIKLTPDGKTYAYCYTHESSELYLMENF